MLRHFADHILGIARSDMTEPAFEVAIRRVKAAALAGALALGIASCGTMDEPATDETLSLQVGPEPPQIASAAESEAALRDLMAGKKSKAAPPPVIAFYAARNFRPVWTGSKEARSRAARVLFVLRHAARQGLKDADYAVHVPLARNDQAPGRVAAGYDIALTSALFHYAHDVSLGRVKPDSVYRYVGLPKKTFDVSQALSGALDHDRLDRFFADLPPPDAQYQRLAVALAHYRAIVAMGGWGRLSAHPALKKLAARLDFEDSELASIMHPSAQDVTHAVMRFQERHGFDVDGKIGTETLNALNISASRRIEEIAANMERWRWLPRHFEDSYIAVNVAAQSVEFVRDGKSVLHSKAVVGRKTMPTPILRTNMAAVIANPYWDIPDDIAMKSIVPHLRHNADYLKTRHLALVDAPEGANVNWRKVKGAALPYQIRELPGPDNALGEVMLDMPNAFYVYLHGTPNQSLFTRDDREISHGCVRVEKIGQLAALALSDTASDSDNVVSEAIGTGATQRLALDKPLPVYLLYWTASADADGTVRFFPDRYDRDKPLIAALDVKKP